MVKNGNDLPARNAGKPLEKIINGGAVFEILEKGGNRDARSAKDPRPAQFGGIAFNRRTGVPRGIDH